MQASFFADCCICHLPKWHLIPFNYQRMYSRYKIWSFLFCFHSKRRERDSEKTWGRVLLVVIFCDIGPWGQLEKNIALLPFWKQQKHHYKMGLQSWASHCKTSSCPFAVRKELSPSPWAFPDCWSGSFHGQCDLIVLRSKPTGKLLVVATYHAIVLRKVLSDT